MRSAIPLPCESLCNAYRAGQTITALAARYGCSPATIANRLRLYGVSLRDARFRPASISGDELRQLYLDQRLPIAIIAKHFGVSVSTIGNLRRRHQIPTRPRRS